MATMVKRKQTVTKSSAQVAREAGIDITGGAKYQKSGQAIAAVIALAEELRGIESRLSVLGKEAKNLGQRRTELTLQLLPDRMVEAGVTTFTLSSGDSVEVGDIVQASIPSETAIEKEKDPFLRAGLIERRKSAFSWLKSVKAGSLIKTEVTALFGVGESGLASKCFKQLQSAGANAIKTETVHPSTLNKFLRETIAEGKINVPVAPFSLFTGKQARLEKPKTAK